jgi:short-subunit dehydrogenase
VVNFTQALVEERPDLLIHTVIPGRTRTKMRLTNFPHDDPNHLLSPEQVAETVLSLLMDSTSTGMLVEVRK